MTTLIQQRNALQLLIDYVSGESIDSVRERIADYGQNRKYFKAVLLADNEQCALDNATLRPLIVKFFYRLNIKDESQIRELLLKKKNLYAIIKELLKKQHQRQQNTYQLKLFIHLLNEKKKKKKANWWRRIKLTLIGMTFASIIYAIFKPQTYARLMGKMQSFVVRTCHYLLKNATWTRSISFLGGLYAAITTLADVVRILRSHTKSNIKKLKGVLFALSVGGLNTSAYALIVFAGVSITPLATALFILASTIMVLKSAHSLHYRKKELRTQYPNGKPTDNDWAEQAAYIRSKNSYEQHRATLITKIIGGLLITGVVAAWCLFPPSILLTAICVAATVFILPAIQKWIVNKFKAHYQSKLQAELSNLDAEEHIELKSYPSALLGPERADAAMSKSPVSPAIEPSAPPPPYSATAPGQPRGMTFFPRVADGTMPLVTNQETMVDDVDLRLQRQ